MNKQISEQSLMAQVEQLPKEMEPERDLWLGIERAMQHNANQQEHDKRKKVSPPLAWAASIVVAVLVTWLSVNPSLEQTKTDFVKQNRVKPASGEQLISLMHENFQQQKQAMLVSFGNPDLSTLSVDMQSQLSQLAQARKAIESALANDENNVDLLNLLRFTQQQELSLLQQLYPIWNAKSSQWQTI